MAQRKKEGKGVGSLFSPARISPPLVHTGYGGFKKIISHFQIQRRQTLEGLLQNTNTTHTLHMEHNRLNAGGGADLFILWLKTSRHCDQVLRQMVKPTVFWSMGHGQNVLLLFFFFFSFSLLALFPLKEKGTWLHVLSAYHRVHDIYESRSHAKRCHTSHWRLLGQAGLAPSAEP